MVLLEALPRNHVSSTLVSYNERKYREAEEENDEEKHDGDICPQKPGDAAAGPNKASERDEENEETEDYDGPLEKAHAVSAVFVGKPDTSTKDGDREEGSKGIEDGDEVITESHCYAVGAAENPET